MAWQAVVGERLPLARRLDALAAVGRAGCRGRIERPEPHRPVALLGSWLNSALPHVLAEELREALLGLPRADVRLARDDPQRLGADRRACADAAVPVRR